MSSSQLYQEYLPTKKHKTLLNFKSDFRIFFFEKMKFSFNLFICFDNILPITLKNPTQITSNQSNPLYEKKKKIKRHHNANSSS